MSEQRVVDTQHYRGRRLEYRLRGESASWDVIIPHAKRKIDRHMKEEDRLAQEIAVRSIFLLVMTGSLIASLVAKMLTA